MLFCYFQHYMTAIEFVFIGLHMSSTSFDGIDCSLEDRSVLSKVVAYFYSQTATKYSYTLLGIQCVVIVSLCVTCQKLASFFTAIANLAILCQDASFAVVLACYAFYH